LKSDLGSAANRRTGRDIQLLLLMRAPGRQRVRRLVQSDRKRPPVHDTDHLALPPVNRPLVVVVLEGQCGSHLRLRAAEAYGDFADLASARVKVPKEMVRNEAGGANRAIYARWRGANHANAPDRTFKALTFLGREASHCLGLSPAKWSIPYLGLRTILKGWNDGKEAPQAGRDRRQAASG